MLQKCVKPFFKAVVFKNHFTYSPAIIFYKIRRSMRTGFWPLLNFSEALGWVGPRLPFLLPVLQAILPSPSCFLFFIPLFLPPIFASLIFLAPLSSTEKEWLHIPIAQIYHPYPLWSGGKVFTIPRRKGVRKTKYLAVHDWDNTS